MIYLIVRRDYALVPFAFAVITSMHFVMYSWLCRTPIYIAMAVAISLGSTVAMLMAPETTRRAGPMGVSFWTGGLLLATGLLFLVLHLG